MSAKVEKTKKLLWLVLRQIKSEIDDIEIRGGVNISEWQSGNGDTGLSIQFYSKTETSGRTYFEKRLDFLGVGYRIINDDPELNGIYITATKELI